MDTRTPSFDMETTRTILDIIARMIPLIDTIEYRCNNYIDLPMWKRREIWKQIDGLTLYLELIFLMGGTHEDFFRQGTDTFRNRLWNITETYRRPEVQDKA